MKTWTPMVLGPGAFMSVPERTEARLGALSDVGGVLQPDFLQRVAAEVNRAGRYEDRIFIPHLSRHLDEFVLYASVLRDLTRIWQAVRGHLSFEDVLERWETPSSWLTFKRDGDEIGDFIWSMLNFFCRALNNALVPFRAHVMLHTGEPDTPTFQSTTYETLALQLANHVAQKAEFKTCANETCGHTFVRQRGTYAKREGGRPGVIYCTPRCARAQAQREYRRRQKKGPA